MLLLLLLLLSLPTSLLLCIKQCYRLINYSVAIVIIVEVEVVVVVVVVVFVVAVVVKKNYESSKYLMLSLLNNLLMTFVINKRSIEHSHMYHSTDRLIRSSI